MRSRQTYGSPRLAQVLGCPGRLNLIARLMRLERLFARQRSKYRVATTFAGSLPGGFNLGFHLFWIFGASIAAITRSDLFHKAFVWISAVSFIVYIAALFFELH
jgi:hypothetical protein